MTDFSKLWKTGPEGEAFLTSGWPYVTRSFAQYMVEKNVRPVGVESMDLDLIDPFDLSTSEFVGHRTYLRKGINIVENLTNLDQIGVTRRSIIATPLKIKGGDGFPHPGHRPGLIQLPMALSVVLGYNDGRAVEVRGGDGIGGPCMLKEATGSTTKVSARLFKTSRKVSAIDRVIHKFKELLKNGELKPGNRIPTETELAKSFGTSRGSIREAVKMMVSFGILQVKWGDGTYVAQSIGDSIFDHQLFQLLINETDYRHLQELREMMEHGIVLLAIDSAEEEDLAQIENAHAELVALVDQDVRDAERLAEVDARFHSKISSSTHNPLVEKIYNFALELYFPSIVSSYKARKGRDEFLYSLKLHDDIYNAIKNRDKKAATRAIDASLSTWMGLLNVEEDAAQRSAE